MRIWRAAERNDNGMVKANGVVVEERRKTEERVEEASETENHNVTEQVRKDLTEEERDWGF